MEGPQGQKEKAENQASLAIEMDLTSLLSVGHSHFPWMIFKATPATSLANGK
jgi:hypothetical protein